MPSLGKIKTKIIEYRKEHGSIRTLKWLTISVWYRLIDNILRRTSYIKEGNIDRKNTDLSNFILKDSKKVFIFASVPYYDIGGGQRSAQLAKTFNKLGFQVYYIFGFNSSESLIHRMDIPTIRHTLIDDYDLAEFNSSIAKDDLIIVEFPHIKSIPFLKSAKKVGAKIVYENIDNWESSLANGNFTRDTLDEILAMSDLTVGTAKPLVKQLKNYLKDLNLQQKIIYNPNAVDDLLFCPLKDYSMPHDFVQGEKTLVYYGSLWGSWFDWDLVFGLAKKFPKYSFILIGDKNPVLNRVSSAPKNVHFLGLKKQSDLPAYLHFADVALLPFKVDEIVEYVSPLKIFEYIAMRKPVLSTNMSEVVKYPNVYTGDTIKDWGENLKKIITSKTDIAKSDEFTQSNNWYSRSIDILENIYTKPFGDISKKFYNNISIIVLNYNNKNCIYDCINSLVKFNQRYSCEIIVVDNQSTDGSYEYLKKNFAKKITLLQNVKNGCSSGRNLGIRHSKRDYILIIDSDQFAQHKYWLDSFLHIYSKNSIGAIGWGAGWLKKNRYGFTPIVDDLPYRFMPADTFARYDIDYLGTGGMLFSKKIFDKVGGLDEVFDPTCYEDTDLSFAIKDAGYTIAFSDHIGIFHLPHQTTNGGSLDHQMLLAKHRQIFEDKWKNKNPELIKNIKKPKNH